MPTDDDNRPGHTQSLHELWVCDYLILRPRPFVSLHRQHITTGAALVVRP